MFPGWQVIAGGLLPANYTDGKKSPFVSGCVATRTATAGKWNIDIPRLGLFPDFTKHIIIPVALAGLSLTATHGYQIVPGLTSTGASLAFQSGAAGSFAALDKAMQFVVLERVGA